MRGVHGLMAALIYGGGLRLREYLSLRIKDIEFELFIPCTTVSPRIWWRTATISEQYRNCLDMLACRPR